MVHHPRGHLQVLGTQGLYHVACGKAHRVDPVRVKPYPHGILTSPQQPHPAHPVYPRQGIAQSQHSVVGYIETVVGIVGGVQVDHHQHVGGVLLGAYPKPAHGLRQAGLGEGDTILHLDLGVIQVGAQGKGDSDAQIAVAGGLGLHIQHVLDAIDFLFQWRRHGVRHHLCARAGIGSPHLHRWRGHLGVLGHGQRAVGQGAHQGDENRQHRSEYRAVYKKMGESHGQSASASAGAAASCGATCMPARIR